MERVTAEEMRVQESPSQAKSSQYNYVNTPCNPPFYLYLRKNYNTASLNLPSLNVESLMSFARKALLSRKNMYVRDGFRTTLSASNSMI